MHDIGHPPYGHAGEDALNECIADEGGFSHNQFALTIAEEIEIRYQEFPGLNLTYEVLAGQQKRIDKTKTDGPLPLLEVQLVDAADSTTYDAHDTDDAVKLKLVTIEQMTSVQLIRDALARVREKYTNLSDDLTRKAIVHQLVERQVTSLISHCAGELQDRDFASAEEAMQSDFRLDHPAELAEQKRELEVFLYKNVYRHPDLIEIRQRAQNRLKQMYARYCEDPSLFPHKYRQRSEKVGTRRMAVEYIAGMTDRFCEQTWSQICQ